MSHASRKILYLAFVCSVLWVSIPQMLWAESQKVIFILDASGSMWGRIHGIPKIDIAKQVMKDLLSQPASGIDMELMVYGHRKKRDCQDIEIIGSTANDPVVLKATIDKIMPRGMTPITDALKIAASNISRDGSTGTVVLVSDGVETCEGDPCAFAKELSGSGINIVIHTVGFDVDEKAARQLACIAEATGGNYYAANESKKLYDILFKVKDAVVKHEIPPAPQIEPEISDNSKLEVKRKRIRITGFGTIILKPAGWVRMPPYSWGVVDVETGEPRGETRGKELKIKKGEYQIWWQQAEHYCRRVLLSEVVKVERGTVEALIDTGLRISVPKGIPAPYRWWLTREGSDDIIAQFGYTLDPQVIPAGIYHLHWWQDEHASRPIDLGEVKIESGKLNDFIIDNGILLKVAYDQGLYFYRLLGEDKRVVGEWNGRPALQIAPAGTYTLVFRQEEHVNSDVIWGKVTIPEKGFVAVNIDSGVKFIAQPDMPRPYRIYFKNLQNGQEIVWNGNFAHDWSPILLPPGKYRLDWWEKEHETQRMTLIDEFTVEPSTIMEIEL